MLVFDASAAVELLLESEVGGKLRNRVHVPYMSLHVPHVFDLEVIGALRKSLRLGHISKLRADTAFEDFTRMRAFRHSHVLLRERIWQLRDTASPPDAAYLALAEALDIPLLTCDGRLARSHGHRVTVELFG